MDTVGPSRVRSMGGKWYVLVIIDDYSRYSWVFFLESKDELFEHFQSLALRLNNDHSSWPQNHLDGFLRFDLKTSSDGFLRFGFKTGGSGFLVSASKLVAPVW
jgi:hypothetical protein